MFSNTTVKMSLCPGNYDTVEKWGKVPCRRSQSRTLWIMYFWLQGEGHGFQGPLLHYLLLIESMYLQWVQRILIIWTSISDLKEVCPLLTFCWFVSSAHFPVAAYRDQSYPRGHRVFERLKYTYPSSYQVFALTAPTRKQLEILPILEQLQTSRGMYFLNAEWEYVSNNW